MTKLKVSVDVETAFATYQITEQLGEGGAGRIYGGLDYTGSAVAIKVLTSTSGDKKRRFKNETAFLLRNRHPNIVTVIDHGIAAAAVIKGPFYVMPRFSYSLRRIIGDKPTPDTAMQWFSQIMDGVEAAHFVGVTHRDLKPENILIDEANRTAAIADFGVASFTEEMLHTVVETAPMTRLANFQYAAPEQRTAGRPATAAADIYALGLMLNELFTGNVPHGTEYQRIENSAPAYGFLDPIVGAMLRQNPSDRPSSIGEVKGLIQRHRAEATSLQKLDALKNVVVPAGEIDNPLAHEPPRLIAADYDVGTLRLTLDRPVNDEWVQALQNMGSYTSVLGLEPRMLRFTGVTAVANVQEHSAQSAIDYFKQWLPIATRVLKQTLEQKLRTAEAQRIEQLRRERENEERRLAINRSLRI